MDKSEKDESHNSEWLVNQTHHIRSGLDEPRFPIEEESEDDDSDSDFEFNVKSSLFKINPIQKNANYEADSRMRSLSENTLDNFNFKNTLPQIKLFKPKVNVEESK